MAAKITFKAKVQTIYNMDDSVAYQFIKVPELKRSHCDMDAFRKHPKYGSLANSDLFPNVLRWIKANLLGDIIRLDRVKPNVAIDTSGFLAKVTVTVDGEGR